MPGRTRRVRLLAVVVCIVIVFFLYERNPRYAVHLAPNTVGGGSVLRPGDDDRESYASSSSSSSEPQPVHVPAKQEQKSAPSSPSADSLAAQDLQTTLTSDHTPTPVSKVPQDAGGKGRKGEEAKEAEWEVAEAGDYDDDFDDDIPATATSSVPHWSKLPEEYPITSTIHLPTGTPRPLPRIQHKSTRGADVERRAAVKAATKHAWKGYRANAQGFDEVTPVSGEGKNPFNGWGATLVDSLDTLWIMGMKEEFDDAVNQTSHIDFTTSPRPDIPLFEVTIRYLGGLIAAYDVSGQVHGILLDKAVELAEILYGAFDTPNRMPDTFYHWHPESPDNLHQAGHRVVLAELGSLSLEFTRLAQLTKEPKYYDAIARITDAFEEWQNKTRVPGMWPTKVDASGGCDMAEQNPRSHISHKNPIPGREGYMMTSEPVQRSSDVLREAEAAFDTSRAKEEALQAEKGVDYDKSMTEKRQLDVKDSVDPAVNPKTGKSVKYAHDDSNLAELDDAFPEDLAISSNQNAYEQDKQSIFGEEHTCIPQGFRSPRRTSMETFSMGGQSDSMFEYLPKEYILLGGQSEQYKDMYLASMKPYVEKLLFRPMTPENLDVLVSGLVEVELNKTTKEWHEKLIPQNEHLACFAGGMLAMGGKIFELPEHVEIGRKLTDGCVWSYNATASGIMAESVHVTPCTDRENCVWNETLWYEQLDPQRKYRDQLRLQYVKQYGEAALHNYKPSIDDGGASHGTPGSYGGGSRTMPEALVYGNHATASDESVRQSEGKSTTPPNQFEEPDDRDLRDIVMFDDAATHNAPEKPLEKIGEVSENSRRWADHGSTSPQAIQERSDGDLEPTATSAFSDQDSEGASTTVDGVPRGTYDAYKPVAAIYTSAPPATHEEFIKQKIITDRLTSGITRYVSRKYILRPEAIESVWYMYRITGEEYWRDMGWKMFKAIDGHTLASFGHSAIDDVSTVHPHHTDSMESFWIAETLKYFYLLFDDPDEWSLDDWILNTEAHFFKRPT